MTTLSTKAIWTRDLDAHRDQIYQTVNRGFEIESFIKAEGCKRRLQTPKELDGMLDERNSEFLVIYDEAAGRAIACAFIKELDFSKDYPEGTHLAAHKAIVAGTGTRGYIGMCAVDPDLQGKGFGKRLLEMAMERLKERLPHLVDVDIVVVNHVQDRLLPFYSKYGFKRMGDYQWTEHTEILSMPETSRFIVMTRPL
jgi:ribosomal protein S18 acetylase RimI-like enzyme